jgi:nucleoside 2-deoxyribosyltransferase
MRVYLAGPLFSEAEQEFNRGLAADLEAAGLTVYLPQRDGIELDSEAYRTLDPDERAQAIFTMDRDAVLAADVFLYVLDGRVAPPSPTAGATP